MSYICRISDLKIFGKKILLRVDLNVPMENGMISDDTRIEAVIPTIHSLLEKGASHIILISHLGRPRGKEQKQTLKPISTHLATLLQKEVLFFSDSVFEDSLKKKIDTTPSGSLVMLENLRFYEAEEEPEKDPLFAQKLAELGDIYINDAFGTAHRAHTSTTTIAQFFPHNRGIGPLMEKEIFALGTYLQSPKRPFSAIIGGAKVSTKLGVLFSLLQKVDMLFIGGAMSYTFLKAQNIPTGSSLVEDSMIEQAQNILKEAHTRNIPIFFPIDLVIVKKNELQSESHIIEVGVDGIPAGYEGVDIGPKTIAQWTQEIKKSKTIFWNGPLGIFEIDPFHKGTESIAKTLSALHNSAFTVVGGGDSVSALEKLHITESISHISTGGGASLEFIEKGSLPGIDALLGDS